MAKNDNMLGSWAFLIGVIVALVLGIIGSTNVTWAMILTIIGIIIGLLNVSGKEAYGFMISGAVLVIVSGMGQGATVAVPYLGSILSNLLLIFVPATIIVAIRNVFSIARN